MFSGFDIRRNDCSLCIHWRVLPKEGVSSVALTLFSQNHLTTPCDCVILSMLTVKSKSVNVSRVHWVGLVLRLVRFEWLCNFGLRQLISKSYRMTY